MFKKLPVWDSLLQLQHRIWPLSMKGDPLKPLPAGRWLEVLQMNRSTLCFGPLLPPPPPLLSPSFVVWSPAQGRVETIPARSMSSALRWCK